MVLKQLFRKKMHFRGSEVETGMRLKKGSLVWNFPSPCLSWYALESNVFMRIDKLDQSWLTGKLE